MVSVSVNGMPRQQWSAADHALALKVAMRVLEGCGIPDTDRHEDGTVTTVVRRQCTDSERRKVVEKYLQA
jgi:hypothetical protein